MSSRILIVDDDSNMRLALRDRFTGLGYRTLEAGTCAEARDVLKDREFDLILLDLQLPDGDGLDLLDEITKLEESFEVIVISAYGTIQKAVEAMRRGACDFVTKPFEMPDLEARVHKALDYRRLKREAVSCQADRLEKTKHRVLGKSEKMNACLELARLLAQTDTTVLVLGETGTGKEVLAHYIHAQSPRFDKPFVTISCANFSEQLIEDELFGHEPGAFTGATKLKQGKVELADGGTLFFDEIGELPRELQTKLLRFLENRTYTRVGGNKEREADVRLISATNRNLASEVKKGTFREDLYYRLNVCPVTLPPLRERVDDIPDLVNHFMKEMAAKQSRKPLTISDEAMDILKKFHWPGNVRELRNVVERITILTEGEIIETEYLPSLDISTEPAIPMGGYREKMIEHEKAVLLSALEQTDWNQSEAARKLNIHRTHFIRLMNRHGLRRGM